MPASAAGRPLCHLLYTRKHSRERFVSWEGIGLRASERAYRWIRSRIASGDHPVGGHLKEEELAEAIGVSRTPVREALQKLAAEGIVEFVPHRGAYVATWSATDIEEIFDLRARLESYGARRAASGVSSEQIVRLRSLANQMDAAARTRSANAADLVAELNNEFHQIIVEAAHSDRLAPLVTGLIQVALVHRTFRRYSPRHLARSLAHHHELVDALEARDPDWAESVMRSHVRAALAALLDPERTVSEPDHG